MIGGMGKGGGRGVENKNLKKSLNNKSSLNGIPSEVIWGDFN